MISFTKRFDDNSNAEGYVFTFYCDVSDEPFRSTFIESKSDKKSDGLRTAGKISGIGGLFAKSGIAKSFTKSIGIENIDEIVKKGVELAEEGSLEYGEHSSEHMREKESAFQVAQEEVKKYFTYCSVCNRWACNHCWDSSKGVCIQDANVAICPKCHKPAGSTKFCTSCGSPLSLVCPKCGVSLPAGTKFCGECGTSL